VCKPDNKPSSGLVRLTPTFDGNMIGASDLRRRVSWPLNRAASVNKISGAVGTILKRKGGEIWSVRPDQTVYEAIEMMADKGVGALLVISDGKLAGIISERDYARKVILQGRSSRTTVIQEIMTSPVISVSPKEAVEECMELMTRNRIRHLPIMENERVIGIVSIGDLVKWLVSEQEETIEHLHNYISAKYPS
jgi:CBS domain-containing protein